jgi:uncharacterized protein (DUF58 family)
MMNNQTKPLVFLVYVLLFVGLIAQKGSLLALAIPFIVYLVAGLVFTPEKPNLQGERILDDDRVTQNAPLAVRLRITNLGAPIENLQVDESVPTGLKVIEGHANLITSLDAGETVEINYTLRGKRGYYHLAGCDVKVRDHLGLIQKQQELSLSNRFLVLPQAYRLPNIAIRPRNTRVYPGLIPARKGGPGVEFFGIREYHSGDPMRWINDRISARHEQTIYVNEFEQERAVDVGIILDCRKETNLFRGNADLLEHATHAAATLAESFLSYGNRVGLLIYGGGRIWVHPGYGKIQRERILQALATVRLYDRIIDKELSYLPTRLFPARSQLVLISSLLFEDLPTLISLRAHGYPLLIISPDPVEFETNLLGNNRYATQASRFARLERDFLLRQLRRSGARVFEWQVERPFHQAAHFALSQAAPWRRTLGVTRA